MQIHFSGFDGEVGRMLGCQSWRQEGQHSKLLLACVGRHERELLATCSPARRFVLSVQEAANSISSRPSPVSHKGKVFEALYGVQEGLPKVSG